MPYSCAGVTSVRANLALLIFSLKKKEVCFLTSWNDSVPLLLLPLLLLKIDMIQDSESAKKRKVVRVIFTSGLPSLMRT